MLTEGFTCSVFFHNFLYLACIVVDVFQVREIGGHGSSLDTCNTNVEACNNDQHQFPDIRYSVPYIANSSVADCSVSQDFGNSLRRKFSPLDDSEWHNMLNEGSFSFPSSEEIGPMTDAIGFDPDFEYSSADTIGPSWQSGDQFVVDEVPAHSLEIPGHSYRSESNNHVSPVDRIYSLFANATSVCKSPQIHSGPEMVQIKDERADFHGLHFATLIKEVSAGKNLSSTAEKSIRSADSYSVLSCISRDATKQSLDVSENCEKEDSLKLFKRARLSEEAANEFKSISSIKDQLLGCNASKRCLSRSELLSFGKNNPGYRNDETSKYPSRQHRDPLHSSPESSQSNSVDCKSHDGDADICIVEEMSHPARPNLPVTAVNTPTSHGALNYSAVGLPRPRVNSEQLVFRVALQVLIIRMIFLFQEWKLHSFVTRSLTVCHDHVSSVYLLLFVAHCIRFKFWCTNKLATRHVQ